MHQYSVSLLCSLITNHFVSILFSQSLSCVLCPLQEKLVESRNNCKPSVFSSVVSEVD